MTPEERRKAEARLDLDTRLFGWFAISACALLAGIGIYGTIYH